MNGYPNQMFNPYGFLQQYQTPQLPSTQVTKVHGENGARAYTMGPNSSALLLDESQPIVWLKVTDGASFPTITPYKITPCEKEEDTLATSITKLDERISKIEEKVFKQTAVKKNVENE